MVKGGTGMSAKRWGVRLDRGKFSRRTTKKGVQSRGSKRGTVVPLQKLASMTDEEARAYVARSRRADEP